MEEYHKIETLFDRDERFKVMPDKWRLPEFDYLQNNKWRATEKIDGTNIRVHFDGQRVIFGGRSDNAQTPTFLLTKLQELFPIEKLQLIYAISNSPFTLYGEGYGARIQKGGGNYIPNGVDFILFDVRVGTWWLEWDNVKTTAQTLGIRHVPVVCEGSLSEAVNMVKLGYNSTFGSFLAEGVVLKPIVELQTRSGHRIIGKIKAKDF